MEDKKIMPKVSHNVILEGRKKLSISAVTEVGAFDDTSVTLKTGMGILQVKGQNLHINKLSVETGDVDIEGLIISFAYKGEEESQEKGFFTKLFK